MYIKQADTLIPLAKCLNNDQLNIIFNSKMRIPKHNVHSIGISSIISIAFTEFFRFQVCLDKFVPSKASFAQVTVVFHKLFNICSCLSQLCLVRLGNFFCHTSILSSQYFVDKHGKQCQAPNLVGVTVKKYSRK